MTERTEQINNMIETHRGHQNIIGLTKTFKSVRSLQGDALRFLGIKRMLLLGCGAGDEAEAIFEHAGIDPGSLKLFAVDVNVDRAKLFQERFQNARVAVLNFSQGLQLLPADFHEQMDAVQLGFVLNDQTEDGKNAILKDCANLLRPGGVLVIAEILMEKWPNLARCLSSQEAENKVNLELAEYYGAYLQEVSTLPFKDEESRLSFIASINQAHKDAMEHNEGRECFDTLEILTERLRLAGFEKIQASHGYNRSCVIVARNRED